MILCAILTVLLFVAGNLLRFVSKKNAELIQILQQTSEKLEDSLRETEKMKNSIKALSENRRKTDEKIEKLRSGDAVDNAINGLSDNEN